MMEVDVGQPLLSLNLPAHLKDHSYSLYNPEEGDRIVKTKTAGVRITSTIPPARLSYAPQVSRYYVCEGLRARLGCMLLNFK